MNNIDLHMHSNCSDDGTFAPAELMGLCKAEGLSLVSLTDHNSARGNREAAARAKELGMEFIPGVELDCLCKGAEIHLIGYGIESEDERMRQAEEAVLELFRETSKKRAKLLKEIGVYFDEKEAWALAHRGIVIPEKFGEVALRDERNKKHPFMKELFPGGSRSECPRLNFVWDVCAPGKPAHVKMDYMSFEAAQKLITDLGGISVLAHPGQNLGNDDTFIYYMAEQGIRGLEINSNYHTLEQVEHYEKLAEELQLLKTPGSDFHGPFKPHVKLGKVPGKIWEEDVQTLLHMVRENR